MASAHVLEEVLSSGPAETAMSAIVGSLETQLTSTKVPGTQGGTGVGDGPNGPSSATTNSLNHICFIPPRTNHNNSGGVMTMSPGPLVNNTGGVSTASPNSALPPIVTTVPVTTTPLSTTPGGPTIPTSTTTGQPTTLINANSGFQILNLNALRQQGGGATVGPVPSGTTTTTVGSTQVVGAKSLAPRMILNHQVIGARPGQPGVHECSSELNKKSNNDNLTESSDSNVDAFDTTTASQNPSGDYISPSQSQMEDKEEIFLSPPIISPRANQSPVQGDDRQALSPGEVKHHPSVQLQSLVYPYLKETSDEYSIEPTDTELFSSDPNMDSQARFQSGSNSQRQSPVLNLDEHSHSDIIIFNTVESSSDRADDTDCVQKLNEGDEENQSEFMVTQRDSGASEDFSHNEGNQDNSTFLQCISDVQINDGLNKPVSEPTSPTLSGELSFPQVETEGKRRSTSPTVEDNEKTIASHPQEQSSQIQNRQSILVPNVKSISTPSKPQSTSDALVEQHIPTSTSAQSSQWTRTSTTDTINTRVDNQMPSNQSQPPRNQEREINLEDDPMSQFEKEMRAIHGSQYDNTTQPPQISTTSQSQSQPGPTHPQSNTTQYSAITKPPQFSPTSQPHKHGPQISPTSYPHHYAPNISPTTHPHHPPQISPTSHPHHPPQISPTSHPHHPPQISPTSHPLHPPQISPTPHPHHPPQISPTPHLHMHVPQFSSTSQPRHHAPHISPTSQPRQVPHISPTSQTSQTAQPHHHAPHISPSSHPQQQVPQVSPTSHPHYHPLQISPTSHHPPHQVPHISPTSQRAPQFSPTFQPPQFSPTSQPRQQISPTSHPHHYGPSVSRVRQFLSTVQPQPKTHFVGGAHPYQNDPRFPHSSQPRPYSPTFSPVVSQPHGTMHSPTSQKQIHGPSFPQPHSQPHGPFPYPNPSVQTSQHHHITQVRQISPTKTSHILSTDHRSSGPISPQYKNMPGPPKCFTTDAQLQSQYLHYTQSNPITTPVNKSVQLPVSSPPWGPYGDPEGKGVQTSGTQSAYHQATQFRPRSTPTDLQLLSPRGNQGLHAQPSYPTSAGHMVSVRSHPHAPHPYDLQSRHIRPNLQHSPTTPPYNNSQPTQRWVSHLVRSSGPGSGPPRGINLPEGSIGHSQVSHPTEHSSHRSTDPNSSNTISTYGPSPYPRPSNSQGQSQYLRYPPHERLVHPNFIQGNVNDNSHSISGGRGSSIRPIAHAQSDSTYAQFSSQYNQYRSESDSSSHHGNIYYQGQGQGQSHGVPTNPQTSTNISSSSGNYPVICRVSPIRSRLESSPKSSPPYHPYGKLGPPSQPGSSPSQEYMIGTRSQVMEYNMYQHDQYDERTRRLSTQFTLQALSGLPPGAQGGHHLLVKTESGQYQFVRFAMPTSALTAATGTPMPHPPSSSPLTVPNSISQSSPSVVVTAAASTSNNAQLTSSTPSTPSALNTITSFVPPPNTSNSVTTTTTILGGLVQSQQMIVTQPPIPGPLSLNSTVNFMSTTNPPRPRPPLVVSSSPSSTNSNNTTISNSSTPSQVSTGSPSALATTTTTYRLQTVPPVPPTAASNSNGVGMTASMSMQQQMHLPQVPPHSQVPPSQTSVLMSTNTSSTTASTVSQMTPDTAKTKCKNFLSFLLELSAKQNQTVARNVKTLIQGLVDGKVNAEDFSDRLQKEVNSQPQPCLVGFLKKSLPPLRHSLATKELTIEGIRAPVLTSMPSGLPAAPVTALIPQNQVRPPSVPTTPVRIITPINSTPPPPPTNNTSSPAPIPRSTVAAVQQRFSTPTKSPSSKASKTAAASSSPTTQSHPPTPKSSGPSASKSTGKEKGDKKAFATSNAGYSGDDDINDVAAMGGVNLAEESQRILGSTELIGTQIRSCKDEAFLPAIPLQSKIKSIAAKHGLDEPSPEVAAMISHALEERLKTLLEKLSVIAEHRLDVIKLEERYEVSQDVKGQLRFLEELDKLERKRHDEQEREMLIRAAKSRSKSEDPEQAKLKAKAKEMQRVALEEMRQREANMTALQAIGPRKKPKLDTPSGSQSTTSQTPQSSLGASNSLNRPQMAMRPRLKRVSLRDLLFLLEQEKETTRSHFLYKHLLLK